MLSARYALVKYVICEEKHADGQPHLHAFLQLARKATFKPDMFHLGEFHGHYETARFQVIKLENRAGQAALIEKIQKKNN